MSIFTYIKKHSVVSVVLATLVVIVMIIAGRMAARNAVPVVTSSNTKNVVLAPVKEFRSDASIVSADGVVESVSQADLKSQISAPVLTTYVAIGDSVQKGQKIAELQNADIRAQLDQARASLSLARGQYQTGSLSVESARKSAVDKIHESYTKADDVVNTQINQFFSNRIISSSQLMTFITDWRIGDDISKHRTDLNNMFREWKISLDKLLGTPLSNISSTELHTRIAEAQANISKVSSYLDTVSSGLSNAAETASAENLAVIGGWKSIVTSSRATISGVGASLTSAETTLANVESQNNAPAQAQIASAEAGVKNLEAQLAKTVITSPIAGQISALPLRSGELASPGQLIATVVGSGGLQIKAYVSGEDLNRIKKDASVTIRGNIKGKVMSVAPSVSSVNKKAEIKISITDPNASLVVGESVQAFVDAPRTEASLTSGTYILPIQNVKIVPGDAYVFTVDGAGKVQRVPVVLGEVKGDFIEIKSGLTDDMNIVSPVYEINEGETVHVKY